VDRKKRKNNEKNRVLVNTKKHSRKTLKKGDKNTIYIVVGKKKILIVPFVVDKENGIEMRKIKRCLAGSIAQCAITKFRYEGVYR